MNVSPIFVYSVFIIFIVAASLRLKDIRIRKKTLLFLCAFALLGLFARLNICEFRESLDSVGWSSIDAAKNMDLLTPLHTDRAHGYPLLLRFLFLISENEVMIYWFNMVIGSIGVIPVFLLSRSLFKDRKLAIFNAFIYSLSITNIQYSVLNSAYASYVLFSVMSMYLFVEGHRWTSFFGFIFTQYIRLEFLPVSIASVRTRWMAICLIVLSIPTTILIMQSFNQISTDIVIDSPGAFLSVENTISNLKESIRVYGIFLLHLGVLIPFIFLGLKKYRKGYNLLIIWFCLQNAIYLFSRTNYRYLSMGYIPMLLLLSSISYTGLKKFRFRYIVMILFALTTFAVDPVVKVPDKEAVAGLNHIFNIYDGTFIAPGCGVPVIAGLNNDTIVSYKETDKFDTADYLIVMSENRYVYETYCYGKATNIEVFMNYDTELLEEIHGVSLYRIKYKNNQSN